MNMSGVTLHSNKSHLARVESLQPSNIPPDCQMLSGAVSGEKKRPFTIIQKQAEHMQKNTWETSTHIKYKNTKLPQPVIKTHMLVGWIGERVEGLQETSVELSSECHFKDGFIKALSLTFKMLLQNGMYTILLTNAFNWKGTSLCYIYICFHSHDDVKLD